MENRARHGPRAGKVVAAKRGFGHGTIRLGRGQVGKSQDQAWFVEYAFGLDAAEEVLAGFVFHLPIRPCKWKTAQICPAGPDLMVK